MKRRPTNGEKLDLGADIAQPYEDRLELLRLVRLARCLGDHDLADVLWMGAAELRWERLS